MEGEGETGTMRRLPVGAASLTSLPWDTQSWTMALVAKVLPQPGPPVSTMSGALLARISAALCPSLSGVSFPAQPIERYLSHSAGPQLVRKVKIAADLDIGHQPWAFNH